MANLGPVRTVTIPNGDTFTIDSDISEYASLSNFPVTGAPRIIYIAQDTNYMYRWNGSEYVAITSGANEAVFIDIPISIGINDWVSSNGVYTYSYTNQYITATCGLDVSFRVGAREALTNSDLQLDKVTANNVTSAVFTVSALPVAALPLTLRVITSHVAIADVISADMITTEAVPGATTVEEAFDRIFIIYSYTVAQLKAQSSGDIYSLTVAQMESRV